MLASDRGFLLVSAILPLVLGGLVAGMPAKFGLAPATGDALQQGGNKDAITKLLVLVVCACLAGAANSVRELVKERPIYIRERAAGESSGAYLLSKILVLGVICLVQAVILFGIGLAPSFGKLPATGSVLPPLAELLVAMIVLSIVSMTLGLVISALVPTNEIAMPILVGITMVQVVLSGGVFAVASTMGLAQVAWLAPSFWGLNALASTSDLNHIWIQGPTAKPGTTPRPRGGPTSAPCSCCRWSSWSSPGGAWASSALVVESRAAARRVVARNNAISNAPVAPPRGGATLAFPAPARAVPGTTRRR